MSEIEWWKKTTLASMGGFIIILGGLAASVYYGKWEIASLIIGAAVAYMFPKASTQSA